MMRYVFCDIPQTTERVFVCIAHNKFTADCFNIQVYENIFVIKYSLNACV